MSSYSTDFLAVYMAFHEFAHILWGLTQPTIVLADNKSVTRFFQMIAIPLALWNGCYYLFNFVSQAAHNAGSVYKAADFLPWLELKATEKIRLKNREDTQTTYVEVRKFFWDVAVVEQFFFTRAHNE